MGDDADILEYVKFLKHCFEVQEERVRHCLLLEKSQQKLLPNGWREISLLIDIFEKIQESNANQKRVRVEISKETSLEQVQNSTEPFSNFSPIDRGLMREGTEELQRIRDQILKEVKNGSTSHSDKEQENGKQD